MTSGPLQPAIVEPVVNLATQGCAQDGTPPAVWAKATLASPLAITRRESLMVGVGDRK